MGLFGIGDGKMELQIKNVNVASGETLEGTAILTLNKDIKGKEVVAILYAEMTEMVMNQGTQSSRTIQTYSKSETLDTEKLYTKANGPYTYNFNFVIPQTSSSTQAAGSTAGIVQNLVGGMGMGGFGGRMNRNMGGTVRWYVKVELKHESMLSFPVAKTQEINIVAQQYQQSQQPVQPSQPQQPPTQPLGNPI